MIIANSCIGMESARTYTSVRMDAVSQKKTKLGNGNDFLNALKHAGNSAVGGETANAKESEGEKTEEANEKGAQHKASDSLEHTLEDLMTSISTRSLSRVSSAKTEQDAIARIRSECLNFLYRLLFGRRPSIDDAICDAMGISPDSYSGGFNVDFVNVEENVIHIEHESEETTFSTTGTVVTKDGREINFDLSLSMSRSFTHYYEENFSYPSIMCDPLVINLDDNIASVSDQKFFFDLDADGELDEISRLDTGSGYLALDLNNDGIINDGSELFGTKSGDGFQDLSAYDSDGNGWIDEADEVWDKLKVYVQNEDGSQSLYSLREKGVGALFLGRVSTGFSLNNATTNATNAVIRTTGMFLYEDGRAGTLQHLDLAM